MTDNQLITRHLAAMSVYGWPCAACGGRVDIGGRVAVWRHGRRLASYGVCRRCNHLAARCPAARRRILAAIARRIGPAIDQLQVTV